jgi:hypothetical protein
MSSAGDFVEDTRVSFRLGADHKERSAGSVTLQDLENLGGVFGMRTVVKSQGRTRP